MTLGLDPASSAVEPGAFSLGDILGQAARGAEATQPTFSLQQPLGQRDLVFRLDPERVSPFGVETIVVEETYGSFGNNVYQLLNALILARALRAKRLFMVQPHSTRLQLPLRASGAFVFPTPPGELRGSTLWGQLYAPRGFEGLIQATPTAAICDIVSDVLRPGFRDVWDGGSADLEDWLVMHFRAGNIFLADISHNFYAQPPAAFYVMAAQEARERFGIQKVALVYQDWTNPAVAVVHAQLERDGFLVGLQSTDTLTDLRALTAARHLVASNSTFCEAAALLAPDLRSYWTFRRFFCGGPNMEAFAQGRVAEILRARGTRTYIVEDGAGAYVDATGWSASHAQVERVRDYPIEHLRAEEQR